MTTPAIVALIAEIAEGVGRSALTAESAAALRLRRINRIRRIQGSLAIEGKTLSEQQITAILMAALVDRPGAYRASGVGVMSGTDVIHTAPPASRVPTLMANLFGWLGTGDALPLIASGVFHYGFEFIHPFDDGNGRMGRLWQTLILSHWKPLLADLPVESIIHAHQDAYYRASADSTQQGASTPFVLFMLGVIRDALVAQPTEQATEQVRRLLSRTGDGRYSTRELMALVGISHRPIFLYDYLQPALAGGWLAMTHPEAPRSPR